MSGNTNEMMRLELAKAAMHGIVGKWWDTPAPTQLSAKQNIEMLADVSVKIADALLAELNKTDRQ